MRSNSYGRLHILYQLLFPLRHSRRSRLNCHRVRVALLHSSWCNFSDHRVTTGSTRLSRLEQLVRKIPCYLAHLRINTRRRSYLSMAVPGLSFEKLFSRSCHERIDSKSWVSSQNSLQLWQYFLPYIASGRNGSLKFDVSSSVKSVAERVFNLALSFVMNASTSSRTHFQ